jgi:hypothetical protein
MIRVPKMRPQTKHTSSFREHVQEGTSYLKDVETKADSHDMLLSACA